jgi:hypothetical protein
MPEKYNHAEQPSLLTPEQLAKLMVGRRPSPTQMRGGETTPRASRGVRKASTSEESALQEKLPGIEWPTK